MKRWMCSTNRKTEKYLGVDSRGSYRDCLRVVLGPALFVYMALVSATHAQVLNETECRLEYLKGVQSNVAVGMINGACNFLSTWSASMELNRRERLYNECLLKNLQGVMNNHAAVLVASACRRKSEETFR